MLIAVTVAGVHVGSAVIARHQAQAAADLAALAGAGRLAAGHDAACAQSSAIAARMHTVLTECEVDGLDVVVRVDARMALDSWGLGPARAAARAGPVGSSR